MFYSFQNLAGEYPLIDNYNNYTRLTAIFIQVSLILDWEV